MSLYKAYTDNELASLLKEDDHAAYTEIYCRYSRALYIHGCKKLKDREEVKDLIQEIFTSIWNNRYSLDLNTQLSAYLYTAVRYKIIKLIERKNVAGSYIDSLEFLESTGNNTTDHLVREKELSKLIDREIEALPSKMRNIFYMSRKSNLSHKQIAAQLQLSESTVKKQVQNALKVLRLKLDTFLFLLLIFLS